MTLSIELVVLLCTLFIALIALVYRNMDTKVNNVNTSLTNHKAKTEMDLIAVKQRSVDKETCSLRVQLHEERFSNINTKFEEVKLQNKDYHDSLTRSLKELHDTVDNIRECVIKLSSGKDCE